MSDESEIPPTETPSPPQLESITGGKASKRGGRRPKYGRPQKRLGHIDRALYDAMAERYLGGERQQAALASKTGVSKPTAKRAIERGWPDRGWPSLKSRAQLYDKLHAETQITTANPARGKDARDWVQMRDDFVSICNGVRVGLSRAVIVLNKAVDGATATELRAVREVHMEEVLDDKGRVTKRIPRTITVDVQMPPSIFRIAESLSSVASALKQTALGELEVLMAKLPAGSFGKAGHKLTQAQIEYMAANNGAIPPGVDLDDLGEA